MTTQTLDARAATTAVQPRRIDTHHHLFPPAWLAAHRDTIVNAAPGIAASVALDWTPQRSLEAMDKFDIETAILSMATPGVWFGDAAAARREAREVNEYAARLVADHPRRFGSFAVLPLPDVEGSLREIEYALDTLKLDGFGLLTSYGRIWPGDPKFAPVWEELNRRKGVVYFHPTCPEFNYDLIPDVPHAVTEFVFDTTRAICSLLYSGTLSRNPDIRFIFSHGGGTAPYLADRIASVLRRPLADEFRARVPKGTAYELKKLYYDVVSISGNPPGFRTLMSIADPARLLFGTDFPYYRIENTVTNGLPNCGLSEAEMAGINRGNALALFPRLSRY